MANIGYIVRQTLLNQDVNKEYIMKYIIIVSISIVVLLLILIIINNNRK